MKKVISTLYFILNSHKTSLALSGLFLVLGFLSGRFLFPKNNEEDSPIKEVRFQEQYKFISPLLECGSNLGAYKATRNIKAAIQSYVDTQKTQGKINEAAIYYRDLNNGPTMEINQNLLFSPVSLLKVPLMMVYFEEAEKNPTILQEKILTGSDLKTTYDNQDFQPKVKLKENTEYKVADLIRNMIIYSDNVAANLLYEAAGISRIAQLFTSLRLQLNTDETPNKNLVVTVKEYAAFFRILYNSSYLNQNYSEEALKILSETDFNNGITNPIPKDIKVSHKFGERYVIETGEKQLHDCGIVYTTKTPYLLCVMTRGSNFDSLAQTIQHISYLVYDYASKGNY